MNGELKERDMFKVNMLARSRRAAKEHRVAVGSHIASFLVLKLDFFAAVVEFLRKLAKIETNKLKKFLFSQNELKVSKDFKG